MNASVKYNGGFLPDIILLTQRFYHRGTPFKCHEEVCLCNEVHRQVRRKKERTKKKKKKKKKKPMTWSHLNVSIFFPLTGGCS